MSASDGMTPEQFAASFRRVADWAGIEELERESPFAQLPREHWSS
jgi:hypothetical protein